MFVLISKVNTHYQVDGFTFCYHYYPATKEFDHEELFFGVTWKNGIDDIEMRISLLSFISAYSTSLAVPTMLGVAGFSKNSNEILRPNYCCLRVGVLELKINSENIQTKIDFTKIALSSQLILKGVRTETKYNGLSLVGSKPSLTLASDCK